MPILLWRGEVGMGVKGRGGKSFQYIYHFTCLWDLLKIKVNPWKLEASQCFKHFKKFISQEAYAFLAQVLVTMKILIFNIRMADRRFFFHSLCIFLLLALPPSLFCFLSPYQSKIPLQFDKAKTVALFLRVSLTDTNPIQSYHMHISDPRKMV